MQPVLSALQHNLTKLGDSPLSTRGEFNKALRREQGRVVGSSRTIRRLMALHGVLMPLSRTPGCHLVTPHLALGPGLRAAIVTHA
jgi:hypothetical protein